MHPTTQTANPFDNDAPIGHGQACAGIIAANHNTIGIRGIAPQTRIIPINIFNDWFVDRVFNGLFWEDIVRYREDFQNISDAIDEAWDTHNADILSNSWGYGTTANISDAIASAINRARTQGRNGRGCPVFFASGNFHPDVADVSYPANINEVITVGAIDNKGAIHNYSQRGNSMDLVAPSGGNPGDIVTTDRMGNLGYVAGNYYTQFNGTSAACPQVAGVAALMLSVRPDLTETQVRTTLQNTARDLGTSGFDNTYGYGLVNAYAAVDAVAPSISGPSLLCDQATYTINNLPDGATVEWSTDYHCSILSGQGTDSVTIQREFTGFTESGRITAVLTVGDQEIRLNRTGIRMGTRTPAFEVYDSQGLYILSPPYYTGIQYRIAATFQGVMNIPVNDIRWMITPPLSSDLFPWEHSGKSVPFMAYEAGDYNIALRYYNPNECGWSVTLAKNINFRPGSGGITLHPNPASGYVVVAFKEDESEPILSKETEVPTKTEPYHIQLWLSLGLVKTAQADQPEYQLDLTGVPPGFYYVHVIKDGQTHRRQLVVQ